MDKRASSNLDDIKNKPPIMEGHNIFRLQQTAVPLDDCLIKSDIFKNSFRGCVNNSTHLNV